MTHTEPGNEETTRTIAGASVLLFRDDSVLLVRRRRGAMAGLWSAPGGHVMPAESAAAAARRELAEETGIIAGPLIAITTHTVDLPATNDAPGRRFEIAVFAGHDHSTAQPKAASDAADARFVALPDLAGLPTTPGLADLAAEARRRLTTNDP